MKLAFKKLEFELLLLLALLMLTMYEDFIVERHYSAIFIGILFIVQTIRFAWIYKGSSRYIFESDEKMLERIKRRSLNKYDNK